MNRPAPLNFDPQPAPVSAPAGRVPESDLGHLRRVLVEIKKGLKQAMFNRHRTDLFESYIGPAHALLTQFLEVHRACEVRLEVSTFYAGDTPLLEDDANEGNIIYPLWASGVRLLVFQQGVSAADLLRFFMTVVDFKKSDRGDDLATHLWKSEFRGIEWVAVAEFEFEDEEEAAEVEVEVDKVLQFLQDQLRADAADAIGFARVSVADLDLKLEQLEQIRQAVVKDQTVDRSDRRSVQHEIGADDKRLLQRITAILMDVLHVPILPREQGDIQQAFEQLMDALLLEGQLASIDRLLETCEALTKKGDLPPESREFARVLADRLYMLMHDGQRIRAVGAALNAGATKDMEALGRYLRRLGATATLLLLELLDTLNAPGHRRVVADVIADVGQQGVPMFARRLPSASSNLAKDLLYIIDRINPPNKVELFAPILKHENAVLRMEGLTTIGRTKDEKCFRIIESVMHTHEVAQMRAHAARILGEYPLAWAEPVLLSLAKSEAFEQKPDGEKRAVYGALAKLGSPNSQAFILAALAEKSSLFKRKIDDKKLMVISALQSVPGMPTLQLLVDVAKDDKTHSGEVRDAARDAAHEVKKRLLGPGAEA